MRATWSPTGTSSCVTATSGRGAGKKGKRASGLKKSAAGQDGGGPPPVRGLH